MGFGKKKPATKNGRAISKVESADALVVGSTQLFEGGQLRYIPMPTPDPKDPLNLPEWRKWTAVAVLCFFGALALSAESIIGALIPVFVLEYAGIDPKVLANFDLAAASRQGNGNGSPLSALAGLGGPPLSKVTLLSTLPIIINGVASYMLVPLSIAVGRRPVLLFSGMLAWVGGLLAGFSTSLNSHLVARALQGFGAGAVEALIPLIIQDMMFIHQRNRAIATINSSQGLIIVSLGIASPVIVIRLHWRFLYYLTSGVAFFAWILLILFVPETRWVRSKDELAGKKVHPLRPGETRPRLDYAHYGYRTNTTEFGIFNTPSQWKLSAVSVWDTAKTTVFPNVIWIIALSSIMVAASSAAGQTGSTILIAAGWKFETLGIAVVPIVIASPFVWLFGGYLADKVSNYVARRNDGRREPEAHLLSLIIPLTAGIAGPLMFGFAAANIRTLPSWVVLVGIFLLGFGGMTVHTVVSVYLVESYPNYAGPVLVTVSSLRLIFGFLLTFGVTGWISSLGFLMAFGIYSAALGGVALMLPLMYLYGKNIRAWTAGRLDAKPVKDEYDDDEKRRTMQEFEDMAWGPIDKNGSNRYSVKIGVAF